MPYSLEHELVFCIFTYCLIDIKTALLYLDYSRNKLSISSTIKWTRTKLTAFLYVDQVLL